MDKDELRKIMISIVASGLVNDNGAEGAYERAKHVVDYIEDGERPLKHIVTTRVIFQDEELMIKYLELAKEIFVPSLRCQTVDDYELVIIMNIKHLDIVRDYIDIPFEPITNLEAYRDYVIRNKCTIQTRHDLDDYMDKHYLETIKNIYKNNIGEQDKMLIQAQPEAMTYGCKEKGSMNDYADKRTSMCISLCQKDVTTSVWDKPHGQLWQLVPFVYTLPEGYVTRVLHGHSITNRLTDHSDTLQYELLDDKRD